MLIKKKFPRHRIDFTLYELWFFLKNFTNEFAVKQFEDAFAKYAQTPNAILIPSCRWGLYHVLKHLNLNPTDEVLIPSYTFEALPFAVLACGAKIKYVEPKPQHFNVDLGVIQSAVSKKTKVILVSHLYGQSSDVQKIAEFCHANKIFLIEDCAHACGAEEAEKKVGTFGHVGLFSFGVGKNMNTLGGGMLVTNEHAIALYIQDQVSNLPKQPLSQLIFQAIKTYMMALLTGSFFSFFTFPLMKIILQYKINFFDDLVNEKVDLKSFETNILQSKKTSHAQAALGYLKLKKLEQIRADLAERAKLYDQNLSEQVKWPLFEKDRGSQALSYYVVKLPNRDSLRHALLKKGIDTKSCDMNNCPALTQPEEQIHFLATKMVKDQVLEIPNHQNMKYHEIVYIAQEINQLIKNDERSV